MRRLTESAPFPIRYVWQQNAHKKVALNRGFELAEGEFTVILDSDDALTDDALDIFDAAWRAVPESQKPATSGVRALCANPQGRIVGDQFPASPFDASPNELLYKYRVDGEKLSCDRTEILRSFPFPEDVAGLVPEQVLWSQMSAHFRSRCVNEVVRIYYDSEDSLSRRLSARDHGNDLEGLVYAYTFVLDHDRRWFFTAPVTLIRVAANRTRFLWHLRDNGGEAKIGLSTVGGRALSLAFGAIGFLLYWRDRMRRRQTVEASRPLTSI